MKSARNRIGIGILVFILALCPISNSNAQSTQQGSQQGDALAQAAPLAVSAVFIGLAIWAGIRAWNSPQQKPIEGNWEQRRLPENLPDLPALGKLEH